VQLSLLITVMLMVHQTCTCQKLSAVGMLISEPGRSKFK
jgi:hypothetical protein